MSGIFAKIPIAGKPKCARCGKAFTPKKEGQIYGRTCERKMAAQQHLDAVAEVHSAYGEQQRRYEGNDPNEV